MVALSGSEVVRVPLAEATRQLKVVDPELVSKVARIFLD
jgi:hypothetical protein